MQQHKGKPVTTSVPSISIKFHASAEQIEELYGSDEEHTSTHDSSVGSAGSSTSITAVASEPDSSPLKLLPRLVKRSTSIDITPSTNLDASPSSDPWRFFSDIKGKITKSVEEKITEIKSRNHEEGSPFKSKSSTVKEIKESSSLSDSEDISESSISKTCGIVSTTEGAEMSSDDDTPSIEKDKDRKLESIIKPATSGTSLRHRFRILKQRSTLKEGPISTNTLSKIYNINTEEIGQPLPEDFEIESGVEALEESSLKTNFEDEVKVLKSLENSYDNIEVDKDNVVNIKEIHGSDVKYVTWGTHTPKTIYSPVGFVDMRPNRAVDGGTYVPLIILLVSCVIYYLIHRQSTYFAGFLCGMAITYLYYYLKYLLETPAHATVPSEVENTKEIIEVLPIKEHQPVIKYEGWVNELPDLYNPHTYHISQTQSVYLRLQGNLLRISHTKSKIPKRALWNEPPIKATFTHHRIYNLLGAKVTLLPEGLAKKRHWSKKYPICITLNFKSQLDFETTSASIKLEEDEEELKDEKSIQSTSSSKIQTQTRPRKSFGFRKKNYPVLSQRFSKLTEEEEEYEMDSENSRASTPSPPSPDVYEEPEDPTHRAVDQALRENLTKDEDNEAPQIDDEIESLSDDWSNIVSDESPTETKIFIFGRTDREKEDWFRKFTAATHKGAEYSNPLEMDASISDTLIQAAMDESEYNKYMQVFNKVCKISKQVEKTEKLDGDPIPPDVQTEDTVLWINAFMGRILFDCLRDENFTQRVKDRIQRKLASIKLPYFIEELLVTELSLGKTPPIIHKATLPIIDERGLWVDLEVTYEGLIVLIIHTKLNLMKLKQPVPQDITTSVDRSAMFNSDVDDSAESTSDEEGVQLLSQPALDSAGLPVPGLGGTSNTSKKLMKMVDRIAESKFFQAATENRYIKKAMEGVSNTDLKLKVEVKKLVGTLVLNIPPPPSDRIWIGFRPVPKLALSAQPIVGERNITFLRVTSWIEKKLIQEFQKLMVIPNMEDFLIPVMSPKLPE